ncbi:GntR family transcriptional regulator [Streptomyces sp. MB09-01]|uniref:GntR family transcriptional regulator n=1 Tax=Streptomyces sp. MB09-01 TaxID=3028666 RepID=UPI0029A46A08|nr:GntR family transcriptional regulator [Streptomyces sp. MB09-01]MDX3539267.1 GntR family transcriptional regulator [Streptomyces sp. MB09-01]
MTEQPKYREIADALREAIDNGEYGPGDRLPGENPLAAQYGVAAMTARQALRELKAEGIVEARKGAGFFVVEPFTPIRRRGAARLSRQHWGAGKSLFAADDSRALTTDSQVLGAVTPSAEVAEVLALPEGEQAFARSRRHIVDGRPVLMSTSYLSNAFVAGTPITQTDTGPGGIYARLADLGAGPSRFREEVVIRMPSADERACLGIAADTPVIKISRTAFTEDGRAVEVNEMTLDSRAYVLEYDFEA